MILLVAAVVAIGVAWALGAQLSRLADVRFRGDALVFAALGVQLLIFTPLGAPLPDVLTTPLHVATYGAILAFLALNVRRPGFWLVGFGVAANVLVIFANGGHMPVSLAAWRASGGDPALLTETGVYMNNVLAGPDTRFAWLADVFALPPSVPLANALSVGDLLIVAGMAAFVHRACERGPAAGDTSRRRRVAPGALTLSAVLAAVAAGLLVATLPPLLDARLGDPWLFPLALAAVAAGVACARRLARSLDPRTLTPRAIPLGLAATAAIAVLLAQVDVAPTALLLVFLLGGLLATVDVVRVAVYETDALQRGAARRGHPFTHGWIAFVAGLAGAAPAAVIAGPTTAVQACAAGFAAAAVLAAIALVTTAGRRRARVYSAGAGL
jgi:hypothetical protein